MPRRKSVVVTPEPDTAVLRRSARLSSRKNDDAYQKSGKDLVSGSYPSPSPEDEEAPGKSRRDLVREVSKRLVYPLGGSKKSSELNGLTDGVCSLRRSPRFSSRGRSSAAREKSTQCSSSKPLPAPLSRRNSVSSARESQGLNSSNHSSCTLRRSPRFSSGGGSVGQSSSDRRELGKSVFARCNTKSGKGKGKGASICLVSERSKSDNSFAHTNGSCGENENALSSLTFDSTGEFTVEKRREIVLGLYNRQMCLKSDRGTARSSVQSVVIADGNERIKGDMIDSKGGDDRLKMKNKLDGEGTCEPVQGWTKEQEVALQKAYFTAKPSPNFWKKVSKLVPGRSAQECFDRVHSDLITPRQPQPRSRAKKTNLSPIPQFSLSASKLLKPTRPKAKIPGHNKRHRDHFAKKTIRHLLEKQCHVDQGHGLDLFSVLEPSTKSYVLSTPTVKGASFQEILERSSSVLKKPCSRFKGADTTTLTSPPVLKQIKNKVLHEKYIDQLHLREAKRKAESARVSGKENIKPIDFSKKDSVRAVKDALILDVKDAIEKLKGLEADNSSSSSEFYSYRGESEEEDEAIYL